MNRTACTVRQLGLFLALCSASSLAACGTGEATEDGKTPKPKPGDDTEPGNQPSRLRNEDSGITPRPLPPHNPEAFTEACDEQPRLGQWPPLLDVGEPPEPPEPPVHDLSAGLLDPSAMYFLGSQSPGLCTGQLAWVHAPEEPGITADCQMDSAVINPATRRVAYANLADDHVRELIPDPESEVRAGYVDVELPAQCDLETFRIAPDGTYVFQCDAEWQLADGTEIYSGEDQVYNPSRLSTRTLVHLGCRGYALLGHGVLEMHSGEIAEFPAELVHELGGSNIFATRAAADGFWSVIGSSLVHIGFDAQVTRLVEVKPSNEHRGLYALGSDAALYNTTFPSGVLQRILIMHSVETLYSAGDGLFATVHTLRPITGP